MRSIAAIAGTPLALALAACAAPAGLNPNPPEYIVVRTDGDGRAIYGRNLDAAERALSDRRRRGEITKAEARALKRQHQVLRNMGERYGTDGLSDSEARELDMLSQALLDLSRSPVEPPAR